jgi:tripartite-type tricarboxylate transporter receptor subunit TctC
MEPRRACLLAIAAVLLAAGFAPDGASAQSLEKFYKNKRMQIVIRTGPGTGYDLYGRLVARHFTRHMPGPPGRMTALNKDGGGGLIATNYVGTVAPQDGTVITMVGGGLFFYQALKLGNKLQVDLRKMHWLGNINSSNQILMTWHTSPTKTLADAMKRETRIGATGAGSISLQLPAVYNNTLGTKFKIVFGYQSGEIDLAMERGETEGRGTMPWNSLKSSNPEYVKEKKGNILIQVGMRKEKELPDVPLLREQPASPAEKAVLEFISKNIALGWPFAAAAKVPADRAKALRAAFGATMEDPAFIKEAKRLKVEVNPTSGETLAQYVSDLLNAQQSVLDDVRAAIKPKDAKRRKGGKARKKKK